MLSFLCCIHIQISRPEQKHLAHNTGCPNMFVVVRTKFRAKKSLRANDKYGSKHNPHPVILVYRNCTVNGTIYSAQKVLDVTDLRMERKYIIGYVHWTWTITTVIVPFILLVFLSVKIFLGLRKVRKNLNRHKRLQIKAEAKALTNDSKNLGIVKGTDNGEDEILNDIEASKIVTCSTMVNGNGSNGKGSNGNVSNGKGSNGNVSNGNGSNGIRRSIPSIIINPDPEMIPMDDLVQDETPVPNGNTLAVESQNSSKRNSRSNSGSEPG